MSQKCKGASAKESSFSRREFLQAGATAVVGSALVQSLVGETPARSFVESAAFTRGGSGKRILQVGPLRAAPGTRVIDRVPVGKLLDGTDCFLPLILVNGLEPGPILGLFACMYGLGYEQGIEIVRRVTREAIDPQTLGGAIIASPVIAPSAFNARTQFAAEDRVDMQEAFPGDRHGTLSQRIAAFLFDECIRQCQVVINFHAKARIDWSVIFTHKNKEVVEKSWGLARAYGTPIFEMSHEQLPHSLCVSAMNIGIPGMISEPVWPPIKGPQPGTSVRGVLNVMKHLGMIPGQIEPQNENLVPPGFYKRTFLRARQPGMVQPLKEPGDPVQEGEVVAYVRTILGELVEEVRSPASGYWRRVASHRVVQMGGLVGEMFAFT